jgi:diguanylate cyclase (GGDEF)-like protein
VLGRRIELTACRADGTELPVELTVTRVEGEPPVFAGYLRDISRRLQLERQLESRLEQQSAVAALGEHALRAPLSQVIDEAVALVAAKLDVDRAHVWEYRPDRERLLLRAGTGWDPAQVRFLTVPMDPETLPGYTLVQGGPVLVEDFATDTRCRPPRVGPGERLTSALTVSIPGPDRPFGVIAVWMEERRAFTADDASFLRGVANVLSAAIQRERVEAERLRQALTDPLTGLPNRTLLIDRLEQALAKREDASGAVAVVYFDVDRFKAINDSLGHEGGDRLLVEVAERLRGILRPSDTVARFGGDEFVLIARDLPGETAAVALARRVADAFTEPFLLCGQPQIVSVSIGVTVADGRRLRADDLLREADAAMYRAKRAGGDRQVVFTDSMLAEVGARMRIEQALRGAIAREELTVHYQPIVDLAPEAGASGYEALVRWTHPELGFVSPGEFIPIAEQSGLIAPIGEVVLRAACAQAAEWNRGDGARVPVSVNVSTAQIVDPEFVACVERVLAESGLDPALLDLEITETALMEESATSVARLEELKALGVRLVLDDFGTGYSSLSYLRRFPIDTVKIDRSFVAELDAGGQGSTIVRAMVGMAHALGMSVVGEGVETDEQLEELRAIGVDFAQGYLLGRPAPADRRAIPAGAVAVRA